MSHRIIFVNRFYTPDASATSQILADLAPRLVESRRVEVVTSRRLLEESATGCLQRREKVAGVEVYRIWSTGYGRSSLWRKALDFVSFYASVLGFLLVHVRKGDIVVLKTDPPLLQLFNTAAIRLKGGAVVNWLQDIYPEIAIRLHKFPFPAWVAGLLQTWRDRALRAAAVNVVISDRMAAFLAGRGVSNVKVLPNWADGEAVVPVANHQNPLRAEWDVANQFVVMYSGNFGRVHAFEDIVAAVKALATEPDIRFIFAGEGPGLADLKLALVEHDGRTVSFKPFQPREFLRLSLGVADLHLVSLKPGMEDLVMPSKLYGILAAGRPVAFVGEPDSDTAVMIRREEAGISIALGDGAGLGVHIRALRDDRPRLERYGRKARALFEREFTRAHGIERWTQALEAVQLEIQSGGQCKIRNEGK